MPLHQGSPPPVFRGARRGGPPAALAPALAVAAVAIALFAGVAGAEGEAPVAAPVVDSASTVSATGPAPASEVAPADPIPVEPRPSPHPAPASDAQRARASVPHPPVAPEAPAVPAPSPPGDVRDLARWLEYQRGIDGAPFPDEARIFFRQGLMARERSAVAEAERLMRGAAELDPSYVQPHLALASWSLFKEPSQSLLQIATVLELARRNFILQHALAANLVYLGIQAVFLGLLAVGFMILVLRVHELRHGWQERLTRWLSPTTARWWSWSFVVLPFFAGLGPVIPTLAGLAYLWPMLRLRERAAFVALLAAALAAPLATSVLDRLATPLHEDRAPLHGVPLLEHEAYSPDREATLVAAIAAHPGNPFLHFGLGWTLEKRGELAGAGEHFRRVLERWPDHDRTLVNLGAVLARQGRDDEALTLFVRATQLAPGNAAAWFNASQIHTRRFDYHPATEALSRASALDFEMVKTYQARGGRGSLAFVLCWIAPETFWGAVSAAPPAGDQARALPPSWRGRIEASGWLFSAAVLLVCALMMAAGILEHRHTPLRTCNNCSAVVCRRCAHRRRELALCPRCAEVEATAESPEFARVLLAQHRRRIDHVRHLASTAAAALVPGVGLLVHGRLLRPMLMLTVTAALLSGVLGMAPPFSFEPRIRIGDVGTPSPFVIALWVFVYAWSLISYVQLSARRRAMQAQLAAPTRSRSTQATRHVPPAAAA
jgi:tetratricopeptide (TPR) repeat protein